MAIQKINYANKVALNENPLIPDINKCKADDMNEIKSSVNNNADILENIGTYSTTEVVVGKWVNNKPIYRKVAFIENPIVDSEEHRASLGLTNPDQITRLEAYYNVSTPKQTTPLNTHNYVYNQSSYYKYNYEWNDFVYSSNTSLGTIIVIVEYTKTTD